MGFLSSVETFARQMQQDLQLSVVLELQASLAKKAPLISGMLEDGHHFFSGFLFAKNPNISNVAIFWETEKNHGWTH